MKNRLAYLFLLLVLQFKSSFAQENNAQYYNDKGFSSQKNIVTFDVIPLYKGIFPFSYERLIADNFSIYTEIAFLLPDKNYSFLEDYIYRPEIHKYKPALIPFRLMGGIKLWGLDAPKFIYSQLSYRYWRFEDARFRDVLFGIGCSKLIGDSFIIKSSLNLGLRMIKYFDIKNSINGSGNLYNEADFYDETHIVKPFVNFEISVGYFF